MQVTHPLAGDGDGRPPAAVDVDGTTVPVDDDGVFEVPDGGASWLQRFAAAHDEPPEELVREEDGPPDTDAPFDPSEFTVEELEAELADSDYSDAELAALADAEERKTGREVIADARED